ncbi:MAG: nitroreductase [Omnitrophica bacterium RIFCSPLOWO2_12_FULL_44_17]|uniref:Nitroreductase n=1 Tax=Candidatus Danuiimicrobium aquiferis TaxID=1801832 RepID=A0A1G1KW22_9BACT|nr:MAG: nitroreductase [Omnitrophica bacterium RIFCSPHIGHO2_02_FULL_45_28]OGW88319.1 MAG: nitroreductase [Omnitrophica bacterium RIFCSPHIGHO2_12_FULL_44_12]OGW97136.1 MAG: nitroreductase [Omnitrophica bacterium RIFCSPLOWO2_12_FULL_44_17]OGX03873.1 MAG: nitroreductase [Omnitrophica bacterium RIFCSPLOWO2_02_FULL_44_11]
METLNCISARACVRKYTSKAIPKDMIEKLIDAGRRAPTARAIEPWEFIVVTDKETLSSLSKIAEYGRFIKEAACCIAVYCKYTKYYLEDGSAASENILLAATDLGLGACWVAGDKKPYVTDVSKLLDVPEEFKLISLIPLGWPVEKVEQKKNRKLKDVLHWEKW